MRTGMLIGTSTEPLGPLSGSRAVAIPASASLSVEVPALLRALQLSSALCPIGAFAFSQGLEGAVEAGWVTDERSLAEWVGGLGLHALSRLDLPLLSRAHAAWARSDSDGALAIGEALLAQREARELREQEQQLGRALAALLVNLGVPAAAPLQNDSRCTYGVAYALGAVHFHITAELALLGYGYAWAEQQVNAAARLIPLGHMATQRVLSRLLEEMPAWLRLAAELPDDELGSVAPAFAIGAAWHEAQYSRLFRS